MEKLLTLESATLTWRNITILNPAPVDIFRGVTALTGPNGSGKSVLARIIAGGWNIGRNRLVSPFGKLKVNLLEFNDLHSLPGCPRASYYQQRYESAMNEDMPSVAEVVGRKLDSELWRRLSDCLDLGDIAGRCVNGLSSGELRKLLIINQLVEHPDLLVIDNPYIGLDAQSCMSLDSAIETLAHEGVSFLLVVPTGGRLPACVEHKIYMCDMTLSHGLGSVPQVASTVSTLPGTTPEKMSGPLIELNKCSVTMGGRRILDNVSWTVEAGDVWALSGPNGSGKSTLLSLITADNPQAYRCDIRLFGRRRGTGESIWDIKRRLAYVSPEMHTYFNGGQNTVESIVAHGLHDCVGDFRRLSDDETALATGWLELLEMSHLAQRRFNTLSSGEQRMTLLARAFVKRAPLVILDEPLHGLDSKNIARVRDVVEQIAKESTLIYITHNVAELPSAVTCRLELCRHAANR